MPKIDSDAVRSLAAELWQRIGRERVPDCPPVAVLGHYLDARIGPAGRQDIADHLRDCPVCRNRLVDLRELAWLEAHGEAPPPELSAWMKRQSRARR